MPSLPALGADPEQGSRAGGPECPADADRGGTRAGGGRAGTGLRRPGRSAADPDAGGHRASPGEDFRTLSGHRDNRKRGARLYERMPLALLGEVEFSSPTDFAVFLPSDLPSPFTVKDFSQKTGLRGRDAYSAVHVLEKLGLITKTEPSGRAMAFEW